MKPYAYVRDWFTRYERYLVPAFLIVGMVIDFVTFTALKPETVFVALGVHATLAALSIAWIRVYSESKRLQDRAAASYVSVAARVMVQLNFGALLSAVFIFYWFSGALVVTWPVILVVLILMISNETLKDEYLKPGVQLVVYYIALFGALSIILPYLFRSVEPLYFFGSGIAAFAFLWLFTQILGHHTEAVGRRTPRVYAAAMIVFGLASLLYVADLVPPVPLTARHVGVYHSVEREGDGYRVSFEETTWVKRLTAPETLHVQEGEPLYIFSSVWAPERLRVPIVHRWEFKTEEGWESRGVFSFPILGGRQGGYRGYSLKHALEEGVWRASVETERGQVIGRERFVVEFTEEEVELETGLR